MKKFIFWLLCVAGFAGSSTAQVAIAPELGLNVSDMTMYVTNLASGSNELHTAGKAVPELGAVVDIGFSRCIYFQPALFYEMTGVRFNASDVNAGGTWNISTIEIPLNFEYKTGLIGGNRFFAGIGPYIADNVSANYSTETNTTYNYYASTGSLKIGSKSPDPHTGASGDDIKAVDIGLGINVGYQLANGFYARAHYQQGFTNLDPYSDAYDSYKTHAMGLSVGYFFGGVKAKSKKSMTAR